MLTRNYGMSIMASSSYNLGVYPDHSGSGNIFDISSGSDLTEGFSSSALPSSTFTPPSAFTSTLSSANDYNLGVLPPHSTPNQFFGTSNGTELMDELHQPRVSSIGDFLEAKPNSSESTSDLSLDLVSNLSPSLGTLKNTSDLGKAVYQASKVEETSEIHTTCKRVGIATEAAFSYVGTGAVVSGVPLLVVESIAFPPLATAIPVAVAALPEAYATAQEFAKFAGRKAESDCLLLFSDELP